MLEGWGVTLDKNLVIDTSGVGQLYGLGPEIALVSSYGTHPIVSEMKRLSADHAYVDAILADNPHAIVSHPTGLVKIDAPGHLTIRRETIESQTGRSYDLQQIQVNLVTLSGHVDEDDDQLTLSWKH